MRTIRSSALPLVGLCATVIAIASSLANGAVIYVTTTAQEVGGTGTGGCSLQEAIYSANFDASVAIDSMNPDRGQINRPAWSRVSPSIVTAF